MPKPSRLLSTGVAAAALLATMAMSVTSPASAAQPANGRETVVTELDYNSTGWRYRQVPPATDVPLFYERGFDDSEWQTGQAGFGTASGCSFNTPENVKTSWARNTDILVRHWLHLPRNAQQVRIQGTIDNDAQVYLNGHLVQSVRSGYCRTGAIDVVVPAEYLECCNLLAIRGHDYGGSTYLNVRVTYVKPPQV
ncbi:hypothetical protein [Nonomuraea rhodomycinica]|uniref:Uncharacterized protein n=1 Tax=Nonomuraea rhodomycinica TaxID=1712872 RepID=A0A7Y6MFL2_9ACTN|nr:hypothetical protein [Nonomuraea rhodomycinica]NUW46052.1 hypothetical protein [Nonomuraea rhodomycinica]